MNSYIDTTFLEYPDNESLAVILYMRGCSGNCIGCHNYELKEYKKLPDNIISNLIESCERNKTNKIIICGGDPLFFMNLELTNKIINELHNNYDICIYTGYHVKFVKNSKLEKGFKFIKCGPFIQDLYIGSDKTDDYIQFATSNQNLYDNNFNLLSKDGRYYFK